MENESPHKGKTFGEIRKLTKEQEVELFRLISAYRPYEMKIKSYYRDTRQYLWNRGFLKQLIEDKFQIKLSDVVTVNYLKRWGFPPLNRTKNKYDQCQRDIREWLDINHTALLERSKTEKAQIYWMGETASVGLQSGDGSRRKRLTMISVISNQGRANWIIVRGSFTPKRQILLLKALAGQSRGKAFLIRNSLKHFEKKEVADWLKDNKDRIEIFPPPLPQSIALRITPASA